jgi:DUF3099 family protein
VVITDAARSAHDELRSRQIRYLVMMSVRAVCLILAAVLFSLDVPLLPLWLVLCVIGMVVLPWLAVILANDRPPREQYRLRRHRGDARTPAPAPNTLGAGREPSVIDVDAGDVTPR